MEIFVGILFSVLLIFVIFSMAYLWSEYHDGNH